jgi:hypothetical protein
VIRDPVACLMRSCRCSQPRMTMHCPGAAQAWPLTGAPRGLMGTSSIRSGVHPDIHARRAAITSRRTARSADQSPQSSDQPSTSGRPAGGPSAEEYTTWPSTRAPPRRMLVGALTGLAIVLGGNLGGVTSALIGARSFSFKGEAKASACVRLTFTIPVLSLASSGGWLTQVRNHCRAR